VVYLSGRPYGELVLGETMTHIATVRDLIGELQSHSLDLVVAVVDSPISARQIIGVLEKNGVVYLDYSLDESDRVAAFNEGAK